MYFSCTITVRLEVGPKLLFVPHTFSFKAACLMYVQSLLFDNKPDFYFELYLQFTVSTGCGRSSARVGEIPTVVFNLEERGGGASAGFEGMCWVMLALRRVCLSGVLRQDRGVYVGTTVLSSTDRRGNVRTPGEMGWSNSTNLG